jgi:hypothetical protein
MNASRPIVEQTSLDHASEKSLVRAQLTQVRILIAFFIVALVVSGLTAVPIVWESALLYRWLGPGTFMDSLWPALASWIEVIHLGLVSVSQTYPFMLYGTDWLAFAHIVIAIAFIGPLRDPLQNQWVIEFGMIACILIVPTVLIFAPVRGIPWFWRLLDISFGVFGLIPLWWTRQKIIHIKAAQKRII